MRVQSLHIYPVKSARGIDLKTATIKPRGLAGDRRFMLVDATGRFITQRQFPKLAQLCIEQIKAGIALSWPMQDWIDVAFPTASTRKQVTIWRNTVDAAHIEGAINTALSAWLEHPVFLVFMDKIADRFANSKWTKTSSPVSFADGYPILITNTASLTLLNNHIINTGGEAIGMDRFRPNIVIDCDTPWAEDNWKTVQISGVILDLIKPCARCVMTSIDQSTGEKNPKTALAALKNLHPSTDPKTPGVFFGWNAVVRELGKITIGETISTD